MTMTIEEAAKELAARLDIPTPAGWPENIDSTKAEFRLSFGRLQRMSAFKAELLRLANNRTLRTRYPDGGYLPEDSEISESSQVDIAEAQTALEGAGKDWKFVPEGIPLSSGAPSVQATDAAESSAPRAYAPRIGWQVAIFNAWPAMRRHYRRDPTTKEAIAWVKNYDNDGGIQTKGTDTELWWKPNRGKSKEVAFATVENVISGWRTAGRLPA